MDEILWFLVHEQPKCEGKQAFHGCFKREKKNDDKYNNFDDDDDDDAFK